MKNKIKITTDRPPRIIDTQGAEMSYPAGIRAIRAEFGDSQRGFSNRVGVSIKTVQSWEQGARIPSNTALMLIATML